MCSVTWLEYGMNAESDSSCFTAALNCNLSPMSNSRLCYVEISDYSVHLRMGSGEKLAAPQKRELRQRPIVLTHMKSESNAAWVLRRYEIQDRVHRHRDQEVERIAYGEEHEQRAHGLGTRMPCTGSRASLPVASDPRKVGRYRRRSSRRCSFRSLR